MSVHYEIYGDKPELIDKNVRVWHDGDDSAVYDGRYGDLLTDMSANYSTDEDVGVLWNEMSCFNDDFADETPRTIAFNVFNGSRVVTQYPEDSTKYDMYGAIVTRHGFDPGGRLYGRCGDGALTSFQNWRCLEWWLAREINIHCFLSWVADNMLPKGKGAEP